MRSYDNALGRPMSVLIAFLAALSLTIARWVTPEGSDSGVFGVQPDLEPEIPTAATTDVVLEFAVEFLRS